MAAGRLRPYALGAGLRLLALLASAAGWSAAAGAADSLYDVAKISVDITAVNAVAARATGMAEAEAKDFEFGSMSRVSVESLEGAARFAAGAGRHGASA